MKKTILLCTFAFALLAAASTLNAQETTEPGRPNELYLGYGAGSLYYFTGPIDHSYDYYPYYYSTDDQLPTSAGTIFLGYNRSVSKVVSVGFVVSYMHLNQQLDYSSVQYGYDTTGYYGEINDNLITGMTRVIFNYMRKPVLTLYSGASIGATVDLSNSTINGRKDSERKLKPAGQLTLFGLRAGKALSGFFEFGVGTNGIVTAGISYRMKD